MKAYIVWLCLLIPSIFANVYELQDDDFKHAIRKGPWMVMFYAPWCNHCKRLAPVHEEAATLMKNKIQFAKVDATKNSKVKTEYEVSAYPKLVYFEDGSKVETYIGARNLEAIRRYCYKRLAPAVMELTSVDLLWGESKTRDIKQWPVSFVLLLSPSAGKNKENKELESLVRKVAKMKQSSHHFYITRKSSILEELCPDCILPKLIRFEPDEPSEIFEGKMQDTLESELLDWLDTSNFPVFGDLGGHNFNRMLRLEHKLLVIAMYDGNRTSEKQDKYLEMMATLAHKSTSDLPIEIFERFLFVKLDGDYFIDFVQDYDFELKMLPRTLVLDSTNQVFYQSIEGESNIVEYLTNISLGIAPYSWDGMYRVPYKLTRYFYTNPIRGSIFALIVIAFANICIWLFLCFDDDDEIMDEEEVANFHKIASSKKDD